MADAENKEEGVPTTVVEQPEGCCRWSVDEVREYLGDIQLDHHLPMYRYCPTVDPSPMSALIPPRLEAAFAACRARPEKYPTFPHSLLVRDWSCVKDAEEDDWWREFWSEDEVVAARDAKNAGGASFQIDELREHGDLGVPGRVGYGNAFRWCWVSDCFDRGRQLQRIYDVWLWHAFYSNHHNLPTLGCLVNLVRLKQMLWRRYGFFFDVDTIQEVYPDSELASWVFAAWKTDDIALPEWRDMELSYEKRACWFEQPWPKRIRTYDKEIKLQAARDEWRKTVHWPHGGETPFFAQFRVRIWDGEELPRCLLAAEEHASRERKAFWVRRRKICMAQHHAQEPNRAKWDKENEQDCLSPEVRTCHY